MFPKWASNKKILLGISGGIAAYKTPELVRAWIKSGCEVEVILTETAVRLVSPLTLSTLSKRKVWLDADFTSDESGWKIPHISLSLWADVLVVAPCTANVLRMAASGDAGTLLGAALLACSKPKVFFPAMNDRMWANPATKENARILESRGCVVVDPDSGSLACGYEGKGRLPSTEAILDETWAALCPIKDLAGKKVLITAGPTHEYIDPVRFISNPSTGKMGYALAAEARYRGASVTLISGPSALRAPSSVKLIETVTALEMLDACLSELPESDIIIKAAAVGDYRPAKYSPQKIKRRDGMTIDLIQNPDIALELSRRKKPGQILAGFAAETEDISANAIKKISSKNLDLVVANDVSESDAGFGTDTNRVRVYFAEKYGLPPSPAIFGTKLETAAGIFDQLVRLDQIRK
ncbi:MAG: bifunctional phosphopantothenoylcysteine decarboxylase/phosphopantothenate--cysteine ligase CoaBC [Synergistaceae bacterium]|jgi:phosphopantothenoylcysteine decarboxylase/phosphopantothenate--cysteine ligase|nr:bifunctional phosphopantothenoylcysteine decarboxylase/phosphopantothenate--cysteine ligase CoaBC [Synergistaceae bacterium]